MSDRSIPRREQQQRVVDREREAMRDEGLRVAPPEPPSAQPPILFQDDGVDRGVAGEVHTINIVGAGVTATLLDGVLTITIP